MPLLSIKICVNLINNFVLVIVITFLSLFGCNNIIENKPEDILIEYLKADMVGDFERAYSYISERDKKHKTLGKYLSENKDPRGSDLAKLFIDHTTHKIENVDIKGDTAKIKVATKMVDINIIVNEFVRASYNAGGGMSFKDIEKKIVNKYSQEELPLNTYKSNHQMIKEGTGWKVLLGWQ